MLVEFNFSSQKVAILKFNFKKLKKSLKQSSETTEKTNNGIQFGSHPMSYALTSLKAHCIHEHCTKKNPFPIQNRVNITVY